MEDLQTYTRLSVQDQIREQFQRVRDEIELDNLPAMRACGIGDIVLYVHFVKRP